MGTLDLREIIDAQEGKGDFSVKAVEITALAERMDFLDIQILRKFYMTGKTYPLDTQPHCFPMLFMEMRSSKRINMGQEAFRKRLDNLVRAGLIEKVGRTNPANYSPVSGQEELVRAMIKRFFMLNGLTKFL